MSSMRLSIVMWLLLVISIHCCLCCGPAGIGQQYTMTSTQIIVPSGYSVVWQTGNGDTLYDSSSSHPNKYPSLYVGTRRQLTIKNVTKNDGITVFKHLVHNVHVYTCALPVYKKPSTPVCESLIFTGNQIRTKCTTAEVFPQAKCQFTLQIGGTDTRDISARNSYITYTHTDPEPEGNEYYSTSCTLQYPVDGLKPGNWTVQVNMYPDLTGVSLAQGTTGQAGNALPLSVPTVVINSITCPKGLPGEGDTNVRNSFIRKGERASCLCVRAHAGNPPGTIGWNSTQGGNFVNMSQSEVEATIQINSPDTFTCQSISVLDGSHSMKYIPSYAYGPSSASLTFQRPGPIYLCPNQQTNIDITCKVPANSFNPAILFTIREGSSNNIVTKVDGDTARSKSVKYNFTKSGQHTFTCRVENSIFSDIFSEAPATAIQVYAPPINPPSLQVTGQSVITDNSKIWVKQGADITVSCLVGEAYPLVNKTSVSIICGQDLSPIGQLFVPGVSDDQLMCQCAVDHETKTPCEGFNLNNDVIIQTAYGPNEITISFADDHLKEVPNEPVNLCSAKGLDLTVICAVNQSDVRPVLTNRSFTLTKSTPFTAQHTYFDISEVGVYRSVNELKVTSGGSHTLVCQARNPTFSDIKQAQSMTIYIREPPSDPPKISARSTQNGDILVEGDDVLVTCDVSGGYPSVQSVTLSCGQDLSLTNKGTSATLIINKVELSYSNTFCICQATHVTRCYDLLGDLALIIFSNNSTKAGGNEDASPNTTAVLAGTVIGCIVGMLVLVAVIALIFFFIRREKTKRKNRNKDTDYDTIERPPPPDQRYQNVKPQDPSYETIIRPADSVPPASPNNGSAKQQTEHIYQNQVFGDSTEDTEPDPNAYSYITDE